jgi:hypothetical protein
MSMKNKKNIIKGVCDVHTTITNITNAILIKGNDDELKGIVSAESIFLKQDQQNQKWKKRIQYEITELGKIKPLLKSKTIGNMVKRLTRDLNEAI